MNEIGDAIRSARIGRGWSQQGLAERASALPGAPEISLEAVGALERGRPTIRLHREEPLRWVFRALGLDGEVVLDALGMRKAS